MNIIQVVRTNPETIATVGNSYDLRNRSRKPRRASRYAAFGQGLEVISPTVIKRRTFTDCKAECVWYRLC